MRESDSKASTGQAKCIALSLTGSRLTVCHCFRIKKLSMLQTLGCFNRAFITIYAFLGSSFQTALSVSHFVVPFRPENRVAIL